MIKFPDITAFGESAAIPDDIRSSKNYRECIPGSMRAGSAPNFFEVNDGPISRVMFYRPPISSHSKQAVRGAFAGPEEHFL
jgi:hypothetical protein